MRMIKQLLWGALWTTEGRLLALLASWIRVCSAKRSPADEVIKYCRFEPTLVYMRA